MPLNASKRFLLLATNLAAEECDLTVVKSKVITRLREEEAQKAGYNLDKYLAAKKANEKLVPKSSTTTRERVVREFAAERRLFAKYMADLRTKQNTECETAEQQVVERVKDLQSGNDGAIEQNEDQRKAMQNARAYMLRGLQELDGGLVANSDQENRLQEDNASGGVAWCS